jgi:glycosyltransferase involved in cell wall biosynthesis
MAPRAERAFDVDVFHPRYTHLPGIGMRLQPDSLASTIMGELRQRGIRAADVDVIDAHYFYPDGVAAASVAAELGRPLVISARGSDINLIGSIGFARRRMIEVAEQSCALIAVSAALARAMAAMGMPTERLHVLRNGVDMELFAPVAKRVAREWLGLDVESTWIAAVSNLVPEKGLDVLIDAVSILPAIRLLIVGSGRLGNALRRRAEEVAPGRVMWRDDMPQADLRYAYSAADVLALPSLREGWPNVLLEAIACGTPVVAADVGGVPEILGLPDAPGRRVASREARDWAAALKEMAHAAMALSRVRNYAAAFAWDDVIDRQCAIYEGAAAGRMEVPLLRNAERIEAHA